MCTLHDQHQRLERSVVDRFQGYRDEKNTPRINHRLLKLKEGAYLRAFRLASGQTKVVFLRSSQSWQRRHHYLASQTRRLKMYRYLPTKVTISQITTIKSCTALRVSRTTGKLFELYRVLTDKEVKMKTRCKLLESCIRYRLISATPTILSKSHEMVKLESCNFFRRMIRGGSSKRTQNQGFAFKYSCSEKG